MGFIHYFGILITSVNGFFVDEVFNPILENHINPIRWYLSRNFWADMVECTSDKSMMKLIDQTPFVFLHHIGIIKFYS